MSQSEDAGPFDASAFFFTPPQAGFLSLVEQSPFVAPGGSGFGVRGGLGPTGDNPFNRPSRQKNLRLRISARQQEFWPFEPIELDVVLSAKRRTRIPDVIDPGYEAFDIWIETPSGVRRRYRPPAQYCMNSGAIVVTPQEPFRRDISIFGESGGYTFREQGHHKVFCTLRLGRSTLRSNSIDVLVREPMARSTRYRRLAQSLTLNPHARLLFYKASPAPGRMAANLLAAARDLGRTPSAANVRYSVGRALIRAQTGRAAARRAPYLRAAARVIKTALDSNQLGAPRERRAAALLDAIE